MQKKKGFMPGAWSLSIFHASADTTSHLKKVDQGSGPRLTAGSRPATPPRGLRRIFEMACSMFLSLPAFLTCPAGDSLSRQAVGSFVIINTGMARNLKNS